VLPLEYRRDLKDTIILFKHRLGLIVLDHPSLQQCSVQNRIITRTFSSRNYNTQRETQNYLTYSYFHRVVPARNSPPLDIKSSTNLVTIVIRSIIILYLIRKGLMEEIMLNTND
jgi:hypothetical protein